MANKKRTHKSMEDFFANSQNQGKDIVVLLRKGIIPFPLKFIDGEIANFILTRIYGENREKKLIGWLNGVQTLNPAVLEETSKHYNIVGVVFCHEDDNGLYLLAKDELKEYLDALKENIKEKTNKTSWQIAADLVEKFSEQNQEEPTIM